MAKDLWKHKHIIKPSKPRLRAQITLYLNSGTWNLKVMENGSHLFEVYELDEFHFPGPLVTEASIPEAIAAFMEGADELLNKV